MGQISHARQAFYRSGLDCTAMTESALSPMPTPARSLLSYLGCESHIFQQDRIHLTLNTRDKKDREIVKL